MSQESAGIFTIFFFLKSEEMAPEPSKELADDEAFSQTVDMPTLDTMVVYDGDGQQVQFGSLYAQQKTIVVFGEKIL